MQIHLSPGERSGDGPECRGHRGHSHLSNVHLQKATARHATREIVPDMDVSAHLCWVEIEMMMYLVKGVWEQVWHKQFLPGPKEDVRIESCGTVGFQNEESGEF